MKGDDINIYGDGTQSREFIYIDDLLSAYKIIIDKMLNGKELAGEVINIGTGVDVEVKQLAEKMVGKIQGPWTPPKDHDFSYPSEQGKFEQGEIVYGEARPGEVKRFISNSDKMKSFGWKPKVDLEEGLEKYINWRKSL
jgi:dTDP-glucose 4,6-dehydratase